MADIELVIKISEDSYRAAYIGSMLPSEVENVINAIKNGTSLPKGHGRLIDEKDLSIRTVVQVGENLVSTTPTIIEADKESEDKENQDVDIV